MKIARTALVAALTLTALPILAQSTTQFAGERYITQADAKHTRSVKGVLSVDADGHQLSFTGKNQQAITVPYAEISSIHLEKSVSRLHVPFSERVEHQEFLTVEYRGPADKPAYAVFQLNSRSYREVVAALETQTQKQVVWKAD